MVEKINLDREVIKALVSDSRYEILKSLKNKESTLSELSTELSLSKPTIKDHLEVLEKCGLIQKEETNRKWKYFSLTDVGQAIVNPREVKVSFMFALNFVALLFATLYGLFKYVFPVDKTGGQVMSQAEVSVRAFSDSAVSSSPIYATVIYVLILVLLFFTLGFLIGYKLKKN